MATRGARNPEFWNSFKGRIVRAIALNRAYTRNAILKVTPFYEEDFENAISDLLRDELLEEKRGGKFWVKRELYWQCQSLFKKSSKEKSAPLLGLLENKESSEEKTLGNHIDRDQFLLELFGSFGRDLGNPERRFTNNPLDLLSFINECAKNKLPAFISVQPVKHKAQPLGIEKIFFDFDYCKNSEILAEAEIQERKEALREEVKYFLKQLEIQNIRPLVIRTRKGYHVHIFFDSVYEIDKKTDFSKQVYKQLQLGLLKDHNYRYIDYAVIGDINRMCRVPFSIHEKSGEECTVVDAQLENDKIRSVEYFKLYGLKRKDIESAGKKAVELEKTHKQKRIGYVDRNLAIDSSDGIRPCFVKALNSGEMCHLQRLALLQEAYSLGFHSPESIIDLFRRMNDFNENITTYQVNWFFTNKVERDEVRPFSCITIQKYGWCLDSECPKLRKT